MPQAKPRHCLIIKNDGIGDLVLSSGVIASLGTFFDGNVDLVTCRENREVAELIPGVRKIYYVSRDNLKIKSIFGFDRLGVKNNDGVVLREIASRHYDVAICLRRFIRQNSLVVMKFVSAKEKYCCWQFPTNSSREQAEKFSQGWVRFDGDMEVLSELQYYCQFCSTFLKDFPFSMPRLKIEPVQSSPKFEGKTVAFGISGQAGRLPGMQWITLADTLTNLGWSVHLIGSKGEIGWSDLIKEVVPSVVSHAGKLSITETLKLLCQFRYYIGNDTGVSHLASLVVPKVLVPLGGGTFPRFFPWPNRPGQHVIFYGLDCYDCDWSCKYRQRYCLELLSAVKVSEYFIRIVNGEDVPREINVRNPDKFEYKIAWRRLQGSPPRNSYSGTMLGQAFDLVGDSFMGPPLIVVLRAVQHRLFPDERDLTLEETINRIRKKMIKSD